MKLSFTALLLLITAALASAPAQSNVGPCTLTTDNGGHSISICLIVNDIAVANYVTNWQLAHVPIMNDPAHYPVGTFNGAPIRAGVDYTLIGSTIFPGNYWGWQGGVVSFSYEFEWGR